MGANKTSFKEGNELWKLRNNTKKVKCIETGIIYNSIKECAEDLNLNASKISDVCHGRRKTTGKKHFCFI